MKTTKNWGEASGRKTMLLVAMAAMMLVFGLVLAACDNGNGNGGGGGTTKSFILKGELKELKVGDGVTPKKVVVYGNPDFKGAAVGKGDIGGSAPSASVLAGRSVGGVLRNFGTGSPYGDDTSWEIQFNNFNQNDSPQLYFAVTGLGPSNDPFMYPLDDFQVPVTGINDGEDFNINTGRPDNNPFNDGIEIECINISGTLKVTGINPGTPGSWPDGDWMTSGDLGKFASTGWLMVYDANGAEIAGKMLNAYPPPEDVLWTEEDEDTYGEEVTAGEVAKPKDIVAFDIWVPAREGILHFDLAFGDDEVGKTRAGVTTFTPYNLTDITKDTDTGGLNGKDDVDLGTGDITGVTIPSGFGP
ncbi:hypothetical protein AGMMS49940_19190 [Spirochaetia bacterium]|nr:hypothetical protein AGMMS49940_19190 [Spirochaetia bacterium]